MALKNGFDQPEAVVIGGSDIAYQVFYDGRAQSQRLYAESEDAAEQDGRAIAERLQAENCGYPCYLYPNAQLWTIKIFS
jgi:hypothetical protein